MSNVQGLVVSRHDPYAVSRGIRALGQDINAMGQNSHNRTMEKLGAQNQLALGQGAMRSAEMQGQLGMAKMKYEKFISTPMTMKAAIQGSQSMDDQQKTELLGYMDDISKKTGTDVGNMMTTPGQMGQMWKSIYSEMAADSRFKRQQGAAESRWERGQDADTLRHGQRLGQDAQHNQAVLGRMKERNNYAMGQENIRTEKELALRKVQLENAKGGTGGGNANPKTIQDETGLVYRYDPQVKDFVPTGLKAPLKKGADKFTTDERAWSGATDDAEKQYAVQLDAEAFMRMEERALPKDGKGANRWKLKYAAESFFRTNPDRLLPEKIAKQLGINRDGSPAQNTGQPQSTEQPATQPHQDDPIISALKQQHPEAFQQDGKWYVEQNGQLFEVRSRGL